MDFGLAKGMSSPKPLSAELTATLTSSHPTPLTQQGTIVGTFQYMAPEQVEGKEADARSDIFSLGAVLYEMVSGKRAFEGKTLVSVAASILEKDPEPIRTIQPLTPASLERTIKKCLAKDPDERWQSAGDLASELKWIAEGSAAGAPAVVRPAPGRGMRVREWLAWMFAAMGIPREKTMNLEAVATRQSTTEAGARELPPKISCRHLDFYYGKFQGLKNIDLDVAERRVTAFIGPSGCGKSTLLRTLNRMYSLYPGQRATGEIIFNGRNILDPGTDLNMNSAGCHLPHGLSYAVSGLTKDWHVDGYPEGKTLVPHGMLRSVPGSRMLRPLKMISPVARCPG